MKKINYYNDTTQYFNLVTKAKEQLQSPSQNIDYIQREISQKYQDIKSIDTKELRVIKQGLKDPKLSQLEKQTLKEQEICAKEKINTNYQNIKLLAEQKVKLLDLQPKSIIKEDSHDQNIVKLNKANDSSYENRSIGFFKYMLKKQSTNGYITQKDQWLENTREEIESFLRTLCDNTPIIVSLIETNREKLTEYLTHFYYAQLERGKELDSSLEQVAQNLQSIKERFNKLCNKIDNGLGKEFCTNKQFYNPELEQNEIEYQVIKQVSHNYDNHLCESIFVKLSGDNYFNTSMEEPIENCEYYRY